MKKSVTLRNKLLLILIATVLGCNSNPIEKKLLGDGVKYWDVHDRETSRVDGAYRFAKDGSCIGMINGRNGHRHYYMPNDAVRDEVWSLQDSILNFCNWRSSILYISDDTLILQNLDLPVLPIIFTKSLDQSDLGVPPSKLKHKN